MKTFIICFFFFIFVLSGNVNAELLTNTSFKRGTFTNPWDSNEVYTADKFLELDVWGWGYYSNPAADFDFNGIVDFHNFSALAINRTSKPTVVEADNPYIQYTGRIVFDDPKAPLLGWPGCCITANFEGTSIKAIFNDPGDNYLYAIVDDGQPLLIDCLPGKSTYDISSGLADGVHKIQLYKRTEGAQGNLAFKGFELDSGKTLVPPPPVPAKRIEFYGDSLTVGLAADSSSDNQSPAYTNNYYSYGSVTARNLNAEYHCIAISGIGITKSWFPEIMNDYYYRRNFGDPTSYWDFNQWIPDAVVINLGGNDYWLQKQLTGTQITQAYVDFIKLIRSKYSQADIIVAIEVMDASSAGSLYPGYVHNAVKIMNTTYNDPKVYSLIFPYIGSPKHWKHWTVSEHAVIAQQLTDFFKKTLRW